MMASFKNWWQEHKSEYRAILFDVDGTLVTGRNLLPGADALLAELRRDNFPFYLLTNDGNHSTVEKSERIAAAGLHVAPDEIVSCSMAIAQYVEKQQCADELFFVMGALGTPCYAESAGLRVTRDVEQLSECYGVIVGESYYDWHLNINAVMNYFVKNPDRPMLVPNPDSYWPSGDNGEFGIGAGGKARFLCSILEEMGIMVIPIYLGKPYSLIYHFALDLLKKRFGLHEEIPHEQIIMLGDSLKSDIRGANWLGIKSGLALTGITTAKQAAEASGEFKPDFIFSSLDAPGQPGG